jgi:hypothetical protein
MYHLSGRLGMMRWGGMEGEKREDQEFSVAQKASDGN